MRASKYTLKTAVNLGRYFSQDATKRNSFHHANSLLLEKYDEASSYLRKIASFYESESRGDKQINATLNLNNKQIYQAKDVNEERSGLIAGMRAAKFTLKMHEIGALAGYKHDENNFRESFSDLNQALISIAKRFAEVSMTRAYGTEIRRYYTDIVLNINSKPLADSPEALIHTMKILNSMMILFELDQSYKGKSNPDLITLREELEQILKEFDIVSVTEGQKSGEFASSKFLITSFFNDEQDLSVLPSKNRANGSASVSDVNEIYIRAEFLSSLNMLKQYLCPFTDGIYTLQLIDSTKTINQMAENSDQYDIDRAITAINYALDTVTSFQCFAEEDKFKTVKVDSFMSAELQRFSFLSDLGNMFR